jgi:hypothetical protein
MLCFELRKILMASEEEVCVPPLFFVFGRLDF